jgi:HPt (histidine-containing phosphotransfer) domain-containing protein
MIRHQLVGPAGTLGAIDLSNACRALEKASSG